MTPQLSTPIITLFGVDPGIVHSGVVKLEIDPDKQQMVITPYVISATGKENKAEAMLEGILQVPGILSRSVIPVIEGYKDRGTAFATHGTMRELETLLKKGLSHATVLMNMGIRSVLTLGLQEVFHIKKFPTTNHQDLQAAAKIAVYYGLKDDELNVIFTRILTDHLAGQPWEITTKPAITIPGGEDND